MNKEDRVPDIAWFTGRPDAASDGGEPDRLRPGVPHELLGAYRRARAHRSHPAPRLRGVYGDGGGESRADERRRHGARARAGRARRIRASLRRPDRARRTAATPLHHELPVDVALGLVDYMEILGFSDHRNTAAVWYKLLNCGFRLPAGAGTDAMTNFASLRGPVGLNRVYVKSGPRPLDHARFLKALKAGRTFATNGPLLELTVNGKEIGSDVALKGPAKVTVKASMRSIVAVDRVEIVVNGVVVDSLPLSADHKSAAGTRTLTRGPQLVGRAARVERARAAAGARHLSVRDDESGVPHRRRPPAAVIGGRAVLPRVARAGRGRGGRAPGLQHAPPRRRTWRRPIRLARVEFILRLEQAQAAGRVARSACAAGGGRRTRRPRAARGRARGCRRRPPSPTVAAALHSPSRTPRARRRRTPTKA